MVAELVGSDPWFVWVRTASPFRHPRDLKGARIGVPRLGGSGHAFGRIVTKAHGIEKDVRFIGAGGLPELYAAIKLGRVDGMVEPMHLGIKLKMEGVIADIASLGDYLPKEWVEHVVFARRDFVRSNPDIVRKAIKATLQANDFLGKNPRWALDRLKSMQGFSEEAAKIVLDRIQFSTTGRFDRKAVENLRNIFIEYGILSSKAPAVDEFYTNDYVS